MRSNGKCVPQEGSGHVGPEQQYHHPNIATTVEYLLKD